MEGTRSAPPPTPMLSPDRRHVPPLSFNDGKPSRDGDGKKDEDDGDDPDKIDRGDDFVDVEKIELNRNNNLNKNDRNTKKRPEGTSTVFRNDSAAHYYDTLNAGAHFSTEYSSDFQSQLDESDKEEDDGNEGEDHGTLIMAFDKDGGEVWVPKTLLEDLGNSGTIHPIDKNPGKRGGCSCFEGMAKGRTHSMLTLQILVNTACAVGFILVFLLLH